MTTQDVDGGSFVINMRSVIEGTETQEGQNETDIGDDVHEITNDEENDNHSHHEEDQPRRSSRTCL